MNLPDPYIAELIHLAEAAGHTPRVPHVRPRYRRRPRAAAAPDLRARVEADVRAARAALKRRGYIG